jgi:RNA polymerase sigma-70 factor (ECF subfamily)
MPVSLGESDERYSRANEDVLSAQLRAGDQAAFLILVGRYAPAMQKIARAYVRDDATAEDVVQAACSACFADSRPFEDRSSLRSWIFTIVINRAKTRGVREARSIAFSAPAPDEASRDDPAVAVDHFAGPGEERPRHWRAKLDVQTRVGRRAES